MLKVTWDNDAGRGRLTKTPAGYVPCVDDRERLETLLMRAIFTDRIAPTDEAQGAERSGYWADSYPMRDDDPPLGSWVWLLDRAVPDEATRQRALATITDAWRYLIPAGYLSAYAIDARWDTRGGTRWLVINASVTTPARVTYSVGPWSIRA
ncbi:MAG: phage GP46 family protein [Myxococcales bacterium]|nr:phage GP46 family protein [Myxococcales bacterium]